jgi:cytochrome P450
VSDLTGQQVKVEYDEGRPVLVGYDPLDPEVFENLADWMTAARSLAPVFYVPKYDEWVAARADDCERIVNDPRLFSNVNTVQLPPPPDEVSDEFPRGCFALAETLSSYDPPEHTRLRRRIQSAFAHPQAVLKTQEIREIANRLLDPIIGRGTVDLAADWCHQIPVRVMAGVLRIPEEDGAQLHGWAVELLHLLSSPHLPKLERVRLARGQIEFERYVTEVVADRRVNPGDETDFITKLLTAQGHRGQPPLTERETVVMVQNAIFAGSDTSATSLAEIIHELLSERSRWEYLLENRDCLDAAIEEGLRLRGPVRGSVRTATQDVEIGGAMVPAGAIIRPLMWSANRDEQRFSDPDRFDFHRSDGRKQMAFGDGPHACPGQHLARVELRIGLETILDRLPSIRLTPGHALEIPPHMLQAIVHGGLIVEWDER